MTEPVPLPTGGIRTLLAGRPWWMNALMLFCFYMTFVYVPWDLFIKSVDVDQEVWFGVMFTGWMAKVMTIPHWVVYAAGAYGFWKMSRWMWPWAAAYVAQIAIGMLVWSLLELSGWRALLGGLIPFAAFGSLTWLLWNPETRARFQGEHS